MAEKKIKKILIIEDDLPTLEAISLKLAQKGIIADTALNGEEALERLKKAKYNLILLDLLLPKKSGFDVLKEIKTGVDLNGARIIVLSNLGQEENIAKAKSLGADNYIIKADINIDELTEKIIREL